MKGVIIGWCVFAGVIAFAETTTAANCERIVLTGHPDYPPIIWTEGKTLDGLPTRIFQKLGQESNLQVQVVNPGSWKNALAAAKSGEADAIAGVIATEDRRRWLELISPAYLENTISVIVPRARSFKFSSREDLIGRKGVVTRGESFGDDLDRFVNERLKVIRTEGSSQAFDTLLAGKADFLIGGTYPALGAAFSKGVGEEMLVLKPALVTSDVFLAFSKESPCRGLAGKFGKRIAEMKSSGEIGHMQQQAMRDWIARRKDK